MVLSWAIYTTLVGILFYGAGRAGEAFQRSRGRQTRGAWILAMVGSVGLPILWLFGILAGRMVGTAGSDVGWTDAVLPGALAVVAGLDGAGGPRSELATGLFLGLWGVFSIYLLLWLVSAGRELARRRLEWRAVPGVPGPDPVYRSREMGPAAVGFRNPAIVLPGWVDGLEPRERELVLLHEREHAGARDPAVVLAGWTLVTVFPWLVPLWWQFRRLRRALEMDCDERVVARSGDRRAYGRVLLEAVRPGAGAERTGPAAVLGGGSFLGDRLRRLLAAPDRPAERGVGPGIALVIFTAAALLLPPPVESGPNPEPKVGFESVPALVPPAPEPGGRYHESAGAAPDACASCPRLATLRTPDRLRGGETP